MELQRYGFLSLLCLSFLFMACAKPADSKPAATSVAPYDWNSDEGAADDTSNDCQSTNNRPAGIVGGQDVHTNNWLAEGIVFLMQTFKDTEGVEHTSICTASLIDTNIVLTAAHCVDKYKDEGTKINVYFTPQPQCEKSHGRLQKKKRSVVEVRIHPNWTPDETKTTDRGDLAMIRIGGRAPASYKPLKLATEFLPLSESIPVLVAGYGMVNPDYFGDFGGEISLRVTQAPGISASEKEALVSLAGSDYSAFPILPNEFDNAPTNEMLYIDQSHGRGICGGDSGGPSLMKTPTGQDVVTGVASFVMNPSDPTMLCGYVAAHTSVFFHKDWITQTFQQLRNQDSTLLTPFQ